MAVTFTTSAGSAGGVQSSYALELTAALKASLLISLITAFPPLLTRPALLLLMATSSSSTLLVLLAILPRLSLLLTTLLLASMLSPTWMRPLPTPTPALVSRTIK